MIEKMRATPPPRHPGKHVTVAQMIMVIMFDQQWHASQGPTDGNPKPTKKRMNTFFVAAKELCHIKQQVFCNKILSKPFPPNQDKQTKKQNTQANKQRHFSSK